MLLWRISKDKWALTKDCEGARLYGGRWNPVGMGALYAGGTVGISALEYFVHLAGVDAPPLKLVAVDIPDGPHTIYRPSRTDLPKDWFESGTSAGAQAFGAKFLSDGKYLAMAVPSVIVPEEANYVINPLHALYTKVNLSIVRDFSYDNRMFK